MSSPIYPKQPGDLLSLLISHFADDIMGVFFGEGICLIKFPIDGIPWDEKGGIFSLEVKPTVEIIDAPILDDEKIPKP